MAKSGSGWLKGLFKYLLGAALLTFVIAQNWSKLKELFQREPHLLPFLGAAVCFAILILLQCWRWFMLVRALDLPFTPRNAVRLGLVGTFYNTFLPGSVGGDLVKAFFLAKEQPGRKAAAVGTVIADRVIGLFAMIFFTAAVGGGYWAMGDQTIAGNPSVRTMILICIGLTALAILGYAAIGFVPVKMSDRFVDRLRKFKRFGAALAELWYTVRQYRKMPFKIMQVFALSLVCNVFLMLSFHFAVSVFPPENLELMGTLAEHFTIFPIGCIVQALIPVPGGLGSGELSFGELYGLIRGREAVFVGSAARMTVRVLEWTIGLLGYIAYLSMKSELPIPDSEEVIIPPHESSDNLNGKTAAYAEKVREPS